MAPQKARNDPNMLKIPKIFDFYHEIIRLKFLYRGSTKDLIRIVLNNIMEKEHLDSKLTLLSLESGVCAGGYPLVGFHVGGF